MCTGGIGLHSGRVDGGVLLVQGELLHEFVQHDIDNTQHAEAVGEFLERGLVGNAVSLRRL